MATFTVNLEGEEQLAGSLKIWEREKRRQIGALISKTAKAVAEDARAAAPSRTGRLAKSIEADVERVLSDLTADVVAGVFYSRFVELGTAKLPAKPFLFPAFERHSRRYYDDLKTILSS